MTQSPSQTIRESEDCACFFKRHRWCTVLVFYAFYNNNFIRNILMDSKICRKTDTFLKLLDIVPLNLTIY